MKEFHSFLSLIGISKSFLRQTKYFQAQIRQRGTQRSNRNPDLISNSQSKLDKGQHHLSSSQNGIPFGKKRNWYVHDFTNSIWNQLELWAATNELRCFPTPTSSSCPHPPGTHHIPHKLSISIECSSGGTQEESTIDSGLIARQLIDLQDRDSLLNRRCRNLCP